jgi:ferric-dicitrate binding protein FerR (iron transport regulator)
VDLKNHLTEMPDSKRSPLTELLDNQQFVLWAKGEKPEDDAYWQNWKMAGPGNAKALEQAMELINTVGGSYPQLSDAHIESAIRISLEKAKRIEQERGGTGTATFFPLRRYWTMAAALLLTAGIAWTVFVMLSRNTRNTISYDNDLYQLADRDSIIENENKEAELKYVQLPDGSSVVLHKYSKISYSGDFGKKKREVFLSGNAFFEVTKNPEKPFFVYANELVTKVYGTSFSISAGKAQSKIVVAVKTGKVSVWSRSNYQTKEAPDQQIILTPNQKATFDRNLQKLTRSRAKLPKLLDIIIEEQAFNYVETPVNEVFKSLESAYGIKIEYNRETMSECSITAVLGDEPLENKIKWICTILEATYRMQGEKVSITGNSCK